ncbi:MAG: transglutaminase-like domain-containing protein [Ferrimicrobium sp.]|uniref:transglutaminase-like domain-containing protein n=1 Tax=Ferrimicrobium sp. TaxID=2926050 RepID=UPI002627F4F5|nr:transglutaminase-like domain-containing protein [Ferrimicrobium sp.]
MNRSLLLGLWATALFWPLVHSGGYPDAFVLAITPILLALTESWPHWTLRLIGWIALLYLQLCSLWDRWVSLPALGAAVHSVSHQLLILPLHRWTQISAHNAAPFVLLGVLLGWLIFRRCQHYNQVLALMVFGTVMICVDHVLWGLTAELPLASYLIVGLIILVNVHQVEIGGTKVSVARRPVVNALAAIVVLAPLVIGFELPSHAPLHLGALLTDFRTTGATAGLATTGYGAGITQIDHSLVPNQAPVFVAHTNAPYYWQAATYNTFNGLSWSNKGPTSVFEHLAGGSDVPIIAPYFEGSHDTLVHAKIVDTSRHALTNLFYMGAPLKFSVTTTVHSRSGRIDVKGLRNYRLSAFEPLYTTKELANRPYGDIPRNLQDDLELPSTLSSRVSQLAKRLAAGTSGPFDAAQTIKRYLDAHYRYSYHVARSPHDVVNQFLFVDRQGYCDQFSTSFIMMMRSLGVPARWVVGYAPGTYNKTEKGYLVRQVDAHSWAQIWLSGAGWVPFDPTPGFSFPIYSTAGVLRGPQTQPVAPSPGIAKLGLPTPPSLNADAHLRKIPTRRGQKRATQNPEGQHTEEIGIATLILAASAVLIWRWQRGRARRNETFQLWIDIQRISRRSFGAQWSASSPREWGQTWANHFPHDGGLVQPLVRLLELSFYSQKPLSSGETAEAKRLWETLRGRARRLHRSKLKVGQ